MSVRGLSHVTVIVRDLDEATRFFCDALGGEQVYDSAKRPFSLTHERFYMLGGIWFAAMLGEPTPRSYRHIALAVADDELDAAEARIRALGYEIKPPRSRVEGEGRSVYFYDHSNNLFELHSGTLTERLARYAKG